MVGLLDNRMYAHRIAYAIVTGEQPPPILDHKNRIKTDNRWLNIRPATKSQNGTNGKLSTRNTSGHKGVFFVKRINRWHARVYSEGKAISLGYFDKKSEAIAARKNAAAKTYNRFLGVQEQ
jgi:hypothetical protein